uniref:Uncharacterized protein LOC101493360 n=1 Tax=Cicer arietinum TaxID=3827 RepID=A0A1S2XI08_CICAR|nr:uncharacterized protein LOC101493360 [Cicer arietinum]
MTNVSEREEVLEDKDNRLEDVILDIVQESFQRAHVFDSLCNDKEEALYPGCTNFTRLFAVLRLFNLKARNGWTDKSFTELLESLKEMLPEDNTLPNRYYEAKKILCPMVKDGDSNCDESTTGCPAKVLWYLPIIPRFKRLFLNVNDAKNIRWHADERQHDGKLCHPADSLQWKKVDELYPEFGNEPRNLRLGLATDGMNPYGNLSSNHSSWPVLLIIYNLPPSICMKHKYIMLSMMISGPRQPGNDIDVYLTPLIEDLRILWEEGVEVFDGYSCDYFKMHAMLFCTINDFPAYGNLRGYSVKGHKACPICEEDTWLKDVNVKFGKNKKQSIEKNVWKKRSVFFNLPYWSSLDVRHCIDVMHVEKNVCDSVIGTLLNIPGKTKDGLNARLDMVEIGIRQELAPQSSVAIRGILPKKVKDVLTRLCLFFNAICSKVIDPKNLDDLENEAVIILCQLEMYFPPSFFDIMVHLIVHIVREIILCGSVYLRWMYPIERCMKILKGYVKNPNRPEASIVQRYIAEEAIEFCSDYMSKADTIGVPKSRHEDRCTGKGIRGLKLKSVRCEELLQAHLYILNNTEEVQPYLFAHKNIVKEKKSSNE